MTLLLLDKSPFYVESGGQTDDIGKLLLTIKTFNVVDVAKVDNHIIHVIDNDAKGIIKARNELIAEVDSKRRWNIMRNHSATHFLHKALQNGSRNSRSAGWFLCRSG